MNRQPITIDFVWRARLIEARKSARSLISIEMLRTKDVKSQKLLRRIYQRLCD